MFSIFSMTRSVTEFIARSYDSNRSIICIGKISYKMIINKINKIIVLITQAYLREIQFAQQ